MDTGGNDAFLKRAEVSFRELFERAKVVNELHFAFSLSPEFRPYKINTAWEAQKAFDDYSNFLANSENSSLRIRIALAFYSHIAEASGFWEIPMNLLRIVGGRLYNPMPFADLVKNYGRREGSISPNANKIMRTLMAYSKEIGFLELAELFGNAFDSDLRNAYAHADYAILNDGICVKPRYEAERIISWDTFTLLFHKSVNFYQTMIAIFDEYVNSYATLKEITGKLNDRVPETIWEIHCDSKNKTLSVSSYGVPVPKSPLTLL